MRCHGWCAMLHSFWVFLCMKVNHLTCTVPHVMETPLFHSPGWSLCEMTLGHLFLLAQMVISWVTPLISQMALYLRG